MAFFRIYVILLVPFSLILVYREFYFSHTSRRTRFSSMEIIRTAADGSGFRTCCFFSAALRIIRYSVCSLLPVVSFFQLPTVIKSNSSSVSTVASPLPIASRESFTTRGSELKHSPSSQSPGIIVTLRECVSSQLLHFIA